MDIMKKNFASRLEELRNGRTQKEFAQLLGVPLTSYTNWVLRMRSPSIEVLESICTQMGVSADWLLGLSDNPHPHKGASNASVGGNGIAINGHTTNSTITNGAVHDGTISERLTKLEEEVERLNKVIGKN